MLTYIFFNTLIYGSIAFALSAYFGYGKYLNVALGSFMILWTYTAISIIDYGWSRASLATIFAMIICYVLVNYVVLNRFSNEKQRDLFGLIFTLWASILVENVTNMIYGPVPTSIQLGTFSRWWLCIALVVINALVIYIFNWSFLGKIWKGIYVNTWSIRALGVRVNTMLHALFLALLPCTIAIGVLIADQGTLTANDNLFYIIKGIGIMIMVGIDKKEFIYLGALLYVIIEYVMFVLGGLPVSFKEALILIIILLVLLFRPEGLLSTKARKI